MKSKRYDLDDKYKFVTLRKPTEQDIIEYDLDYTPNYLIYEVCDDEEYYIGEIYVLERDPHIYSAKNIYKVIYNHWLSAYNSMSQLRKDISSAIEEVDPTHGRKVKILFSK